jgi:CsoR family transcriptional regulator, copper-sensing transcriptional repressor
MGAEGITMATRNGAPHSATATCACKPGNGRKAARVDPELKEANWKRLRRIEGQVRGLQRMVEGDRYCADIIVQIASVQEALRGVARNLMRNHLQHYAAKTLGSGRPKESAAMYDELLELIYTHLR